jgi:hypothetical protein
MSGDKTTDGAANWQIISCSNWVTTGSQLGHKGLHLGAISVDSERQ